MLGKSSIEYFLYFNELQLLRVYMYFLIKKCPKYLTHLKSALTFFPVIYCLNAFMII